MVTVFFWIGLSVIVGVLAAKYGRSGIGWIFASLIFSPLLAGLVVLVLGRKPVA